jgi:ATP-dependent Clp protease ATP-binding subunit ClpB
LTSLRKRLAEKEMEFQISDIALDIISSAGFDPVYGARPLKRAIQTYIENPLAQAVLSGRYLSGDTVSIDGEDGRLVLK